MGLGGNPGRSLGATISSGFTPKCGKLVDMIRESHTGLGEAAVRASKTEIRDAAFDFIGRGVKASEQNDKPSARMYLGLAVGLFEEVDDAQSASNARELAAKYT